jgi:hypothetical protein
LKKQKDTVGTGPLVTEKRRKHRNAIGLKSPIALPYVLEFAGKKIPARDKTT